jgi:cephalosporin-C deacetylase-like acetyl esterase
MATGYQHMVLDYYVARLRQSRDRRRAELKSIKTADQAFAYQEKIRFAVERAFGPWPAAAPVPLNLRVTGSEQFDGWQLEKLLFESRPGFLLSALLYVPEAAKAGKVPGVLATCGHSLEGKAADVYQGFAQRLVKNGFMVLAFDPIHQGERNQFAKLQNPESPELPTLCGAHNYMGRQLELLGDSFASWRVWDGRVALSVLLARPEIDPRQVGVTGNSGGGTLSEWLWSCEPRLTMAAPSCHLTTLLGDLENELPRDAEQYLRGILAADLELADLMIVRAPEPAIVLGQKYDFFERRGFFEAFEEMKAFYEVLGAGDKVEMFMGPTTHGYSVHNQEAMLNFFCRQVGCQAKSVEVSPLPKERVQACSSGNVLLQGSDSIFDLLQKRARELAAERPTLDGQALRKKLSELLQMPEREGVPHFRVPRACVYKIGDQDQVWARYAVETEEPGVRAIVHKNVRQAGCVHTLDVEPEVCLYLPHVASQWDICDNAYFQRLAEAGEVYAVDPRGMGESRPEDGENNHEAEFFRDYGMDYMMHGYGSMLNQSYLGRRVFDLLRVIDLLANEGAEKFSLHGRGQGAIIAAFAALLDNRVGQLFLLDSPRSFQDWIEQPLWRWPSASHPQGILQFCDFPDILQAMKEKVKVIS